MGDFIILNADSPQYSVHLSLLRQVFSFSKYVQAVKGGHIDISFIGENKNTGSNFCGYTVTVNVDPEGRRWVDIGYHDKGIKGKCGFGKKYQEHNNQCVNVTEGHYRKSELSGEGRVILDTGEVRIGRFKGSILDNCWEGCKVNPDGSVQEGKFERNILVRKAKGKQKQK